MKQPDCCITKEQYSNFIPYLCKVLLGKDSFALDKEIPFALFCSLQPLLYLSNNIAFFMELERLAYVMADQLPSIRIGKALSVNNAPVQLTWALQEVISVSVVDPKARISDLEYKVTTRVLLGDFAGQILTRNFSKRSLVFLSKKMGFSKRPREGSDKIPAHAVFKDAQDLLGLRWFGLVEPSNSSHTGYFELACSCSIIGYNRDVLRSRSNVTRVAPNRVERLVQPKPRHGISDSAAATASFLQHGGRVVNSQPCVRQPGETEQHNAN